MSPALLGQSRPLARATLAMRKGDVQGGLFLTAFSLRCLHLGPGLRELSNEHIDLFSDN